MARERRIHGRIETVWEENLGTTLTSDAAAGATVLVVEDVTPFNGDGDGGWLQVGDQVVEYVDIDDDASTITLAAPLTTGVTVDSDLSDVWVWNVLYDEVDTVQYAEVRPDGKRDQADLIVAVVSDTVPPLPNGDRGRAAEGCVVVRDGDEWELTRVKGRPSKARGVKFEADDIHVLTSTEVAAGVASFALSHRPIVESVVAFLSGWPQEPTEYDVDYAGQTITWPLNGWERAGDRLWVHYAYRKGITTPIAQGAGYPQLVIEDSVATNSAYWRYDEDGTGSPGVIADSSGNGHGGSGHMFGSPAAAAPSLLPGDPGYAADFTPEQMSRIAYGAWMNAPEFTLEALIDADAFDTEPRTIIARRDGTAGDPSTQAWQLRVNTDGKLQGILFYGSSFALVNSASALVTGRTYIVSMTYDGTTIKIFVNGAVAGSLAHSAGYNITSVSPITIGGMTQGTAHGEENWDGRIDEVSFTGVALTEERIAQRFAASKVAA